MAKRNGGLIGLKGAILGIYKSDGTLDTSFGDNGRRSITADKDGGVTKGNISGLAPSSKEIWGNNVLVDISTGKAKPSVDFETNFMDHDDLNKLLGRTKLADGSWSMDTDATQFVVLDLISEDVNHNEVHFGFFQGHVTPGNVSLATNNDNETRVGDTVTFKPIANDKGFFGKIGYTADTNFKLDDFLNELFPVKSSSVPVNSGN